MKIWIKKIFLKILIRPDKVFDLAPTYSHKNEISELHSSFWLKYYLKNFDLINIIFILF